MPNLIEENKELRENLKQVKKELSFFMKVGKALTSTLELDKVLEIIMENVHCLVKPESWSLLLLDDERNDLYYVIAKGRLPDAVKGVRLQMGEGVAGRVAENGKPLIISSVSKEKRYSSFLKNNNRGFI